MTIQEAKNSFGKTVIVDLIPNQLLELGVVYGWDDLGAGLVQIKWHKGNFCQSDLVHPSMVHLVTETDLNFMFA